MLQNVLQELGQANPQLLQVQIDIGIASSCAIVMSTVYTVFSIQSY